MKVHAAQPDWLPNNADDVDTTASYVVLTASARQALTPRVALEKPIATPTPNDSPGNAYAEEGDNVLMDIGGTLLQYFDDC